MRSPEAVGRVVQSGGGREHPFPLPRRVLNLALAAVLCGLALLAFSCGRLDGPDGDGPDRDSLDPACPLGLGRGPFDGGLFGGEGDEAGGREVSRLLDDPNFGASEEAAGDLRAGIVDGHLVAALRAVTKKHEICVDAFKEGHYFLPGVEDGPVIPEGYGEAGGLPNTHHFGRAADIRYVDGKPVEGNGTHPDVLGVGRVLAGLPPRERPDQIIGPEPWTRRLNRSYGDGWITAPDQLRLHDDHIHLGYAQERGTRNTR